MVQLLLLITLLQQIIHKFCALTPNLGIKSIYVSGADPGFPVGGGASGRRQHTDFPKNYMELRKFLSVGGRAGGAQPWIRHCSLLDSNQGPPCIAQFF